MMKSLRLVMMCAGVCALLPGAGSAHGQARPPLGSPAVQQQPVGNNAALWFSGGAGGGWTRVTCVICRTDRRAGPTLHLSGGTTVRQGLLLGVDVDGWTRSEDDIRSLLLSGVVSARIYPDPSRGLFLRAGLGVVRFSLDEGELRSTLPGLALGAGYDIALGEHYTISNAVNLLASSFGSLRSGSGTVADDVSISLFQVGVSLRRR